MAAATSIDIDGRLGVKERDEAVKLFWRLDLLLRKVKGDEQKVVAEAMRFVLLRIL